MSDNNLNVYGDGSYGGGSYDKVNINGEAVISGDVECNTIKIRGNGHIKGGIKSQRMSVWGHGSFEGTGDIYEFSVVGDAKINGKTMITKAKIMGMCEIDNNTVIDENKLYGTLKIDGNYRGITAKIKGELTVSGDTEVEQFISDGSFCIQGLLNGEEIIINPFFSRSYAKEIGGEKIVVKKKNDLSISLPFAKTGKLETEVIEGNHIYLEDTTAKIVRGDYVEIGPNCKIDRVEYTGQYIPHNGSKVGEAVKSE